jgi:hypothetical protein
MHVPHNPYLSPQPLSPRSPLYERAKAVVAAYDSAYDPDVHPDVHVAIEELRVMLEKIDKSLAALDALRD